MKTVGAKPGSYFALKKEFDAEKAYKELQDEDFDDDPNDESLKNKIYINYECFLIIVNLPVVDEKILPKLEKKLYSLSETLKNNSQISHPFDNASGKTKGLTLVLMKTLEDAEGVRAKLDGLRLDKTHRLRVFNYREYETAINMEETQEFVAPVKASIPSTEFSKWLQIEPTCEQFLCVSSSGNLCEASLHFYASHTNHTSHKLKHTDIATDFRWSPNGNFLLQISKEVVYSYCCTDDFRLVLVATISVSGVLYVTFSQDERYVTLHRKNKYKDNVIIADLACGGVKWRGSTCIDELSENSSIFWTKDTKYFCFIKSDSFRVYSCENFAPVPHASYSNPKLEGCVLSPMKNYLIYWEKLKDGDSVDFTLFDIESGQKHVIKKVVNVVKCNIIFQNMSDFASISCERCVKKKKLYSVDVVLLNKKNYPLVSLDFPSGISQMSWEPKGNMFVVCSDDKYCLCEVQEDGIKMKFSKKFVANCEALWSPLGKVFVVHSLHSLSEQKSIYVYKGDDGSLLNSSSLKAVNHISWDSSGRFIATCVLMNGTASDHSFNIWSNVGNSLLQVPIKNLKHLLWRPRPTNILSEEEIKDVESRLKEYSAEFDKSDKSRNKKIHQKRRADTIEKVISYYNYLYSCIETTQRYNNYYETLEF